MLGTESRASVGAPDAFDIVLSLQALQLIKIHLYFTLKTFSCSHLSSFVPFLWLLNKGMLLIKLCGGRGEAHFTWHIDSNQ